MFAAIPQIVNPVWNCACVLRDDWLSYMAHSERVAYLLHLKQVIEGKLFQRHTSSESLGMADSSIAGIRRLTGGVAQATIPRTTQLC